MSHQPRKRFGQHFLHDAGVLRRIVEAIDPRPGEHLVEIGPGEGALTRLLLPRVGAMDAVELDRDLVGPLAARCEALGELRIHNVDALRLDFCTLAPPQGRLRVVGNLPYNISTPLLFHLLDQARCILDMHFMLQKEVVERMAAPPGSKVYGRLSVMLQVRCRVTPLFDIGPGAFRPPPRVVSSMVRLEPWERPPWPIGDPGRFAALVARAFSQRRKTLRRSLRELVPAKAFAAAGIDPAARPESLSPAQFVALAEAACKTGPPP